MKRKQRMQPRSRRKSQHHHLAARAKRRSLPQPGLRQLNALLRLQSSKAMFGKLFQPLPKSFPCRQCQKLPRLPQLSTGLELESSSERRSRNLSSRSHSSFSLQLLGLYQKMRLPATPRPRPPLIRSGKTSVIRVFGMRSVFVNAAT